LSFVCEVSTEVLNYQPDLSTRPLRGEGKQKGQKGQRRQKGFFAFFALFAFFASPTDLQKMNP
jgi:hypothetical protein